MHYIVFDLEWNQAEGRIGHEGGLPFEIVEIGAIKLNRRMRIIDEFEEVIRPRIYPHMHFMTTRIIPSRGVLTSFVVPFHNQGASSAINQGHALRK